MSTGIGDGLILRPARFEDIEGVVAVSNGYTLALVGEASRSANETLTDWQSPGFSLERDARVVAAGGEIVAHGEVWDTSEPHVRVHARMAIAPTWRGREIEEALLPWIEERAEKAVLQAPAGARVVLTQSYVEQDHAMHSLLEARGYVLVRRFWRMLIELDEPPPEPQWPEGIRVRTFVPGEDDVAMAAAVRDAFRDHWGDVERPLEEELKEWRHWMENSTDFDPSLWFLAVYGDEIAGGLTVLAGEPRGSRSSRRRGARRPSPVA